MKKVALTLGFLVLLVGCNSHGKDDQGQVETRPVEMREVMKSIVAPQAQVLWDVSNKGMNERGEPDASQLKDEDWAKIAAAAKMVESSATELADAKAIIVALDSTILAAAAIFGRCKSHYRRANRREDSGRRDSRSLDGAAGPGIHR